MPDSTDAAPAAGSSHDSKSHEEPIIEKSARPQRLVLMGTGPFAVPSFEALRAAGHEIPLVVTRPMPPVKSRKGAPPAPVRDWANEHSLPLIDPDSINDELSVAKVADAKPTLLVVCDYGQILKIPALETAKLGGINLHGSLLPKYRGAAPVQWALLSGDEVSGVSVIHMTPRLDGGPVIVKRETPIRDDETAGQLEDRLSRLGVAATLEAVELLGAWDGESTLGERQNAELVTKAPRLKKSDAEIDWGRTAREIDCHVRGMQPWPVAFTHFQPVGKKQPIRLAIKEVGITDRSAGELASGEIVSDSAFLVATGDVLVEVKRLQPAGKREMTGGEFLRGHNPPSGTRLFAL